MPLSDERMAELRSLAQPYLEPGEEVSSGALGQMPPSLWLIVLGVIVYAMLTKTWQLVLTDRRLLAIRVGSFRWSWLRPTGETRSFPWTEMVSIDVHKGLLTHTLRFSTAREEVRYENLRKHDLEDLRAALRSGRPDLFSA